MTAFIETWWTTSCSSSCCPPVFLLEASFMLKSYGWVAHMILVTAQSPNSPFPFWIWGLVFRLGLGLGIVNIILLLNDILSYDICNSFP